MKAVKLNFETAENFSDYSMVDFMQQYFSHVKAIEKTYTGTYFLEYETEQGIEAILSDIHILSGFFRQDCIAYTIVDKYNAIQGISGKALSKYAPFNREYFLEPDNNFQGFAHFDIIASAFMGRVE